MGCVFCEIVGDPGKGHIIYEDEEHLAFLDLYPITEGHSSGGAKEAPRDDN